MIKVVVTNKNGGLNIHKSLVNEIRNLGIIVKPSNVIKTNFGTSSILDIALQLTEDNLTKLSNKICDYILDSNGISVIALTPANTDNINLLN